jgi:hypothetical protein
MTPAGYVATVLHLYTRLPDTPDRPRRPDRTLAETLAAEDVSLETVKAAFLLATVRRRTRPEDAVPLAPIRSLYYFLPVIRELQRTPPDSAYLEFLAARLRQDNPAPGSCASQHARARGDEEWRF